MNFIKHLKLLPKNLNLTFNLRSYKQRKQEIFFHIYYNKGGFLLFILFIIAYLILFLSIDDFII